MTPSNWGAVFVSPTEITFGVTVAATAPTELDALVLWCSGNGAVMGPGSIQITPCATPVTPTITSVQAAAFFAGASTAVTITGTGFIPANNANGCTATQVSIMTGSVSVPLSNLNIVDPTQITATVAPTTSERTGTTTVTLSNSNLNNPSSPLTATATVQVVPAPTATITDTSQIKDGIVTVNLTGPSGTSGDLTLSFTGSKQQYSQTFPALQPGTHILDLTLSDVTADKYTSVDGTWATNIESVDALSYTLTSPWIYFGYVRYTQYNVPYESACSGAPGGAWLVTTSCTFTKIGLNSTFTSQAWLNGTGVSTSYGILKNAAAVNLGDQKGPCKGKYPSGAIGHGTTGGNTFEIVSSITGSCNKTLVDNQSAAVPASGSPLKSVPLSGLAALSCGDQLNLDTGNNVSAYGRTAADLCSACSNSSTFTGGTVGHVDSYSSSQTCQSGPGKLSDLGDFYSAKTN